MCDNKTPVKLEEKAAQVCRGNLSYLMGRVPIRSRRGDSHPFEGDSCAIYVAFVMSLRTMRLDVDISRASAETVRVEVQVMP